MEAFGVALRNNGNRFAFVFMPGVEEVYDRLSFSPSSTIPGSSMPVSRCWFRVYERNSVLAVQGRSSSRVSPPGGVHGCPLAVVRAGLPSGGLCYIIQPLFLHKTQI